MRGFPGGSDSKGSACNSGDLGSIPGLGRSPGEGKGYPTPVLLPGEFHGQRSLAGYSPWGCKELDMTEQLTLIRWNTSIKRNISSPTWLLGIVCIEKAEYMIFPLYFFLTSNLQSCSFLYRKWFSNMHTHKYTFFFIFFSIKVCHRILNIIPWAIH